MVHVKKGNKKNGIGVDEPLIWWKPYCRQHRFSDPCTTKNLVLVLNFTNLSLPTESYNS